jgi:phage-related protein
MIAETLSLDFVGNAAGLQDAVMASQRALQALNRDTSRFSFSIGRVMRTIVTPIASIILSAFAAKKALADFTQSGLPGVTRFNQTLGLMRISMFRLSSAVGELLAPAAERAARIVTMIADKLEPIIRKITATIPSLAAFFKQLGTNVVGVLRPLMPTVFGILDSIMTQISGMDWAALWEKLKQAWFTAWNAILTFVSPILVRLATLVDTFVQVTMQAIQYIGELIRSVLADFGINLPQAAAQGLQALASIVQNALIVAIAALQIALTNIPILFEAIAAAASLAADTLVNNWRGVGKFILELLTNIASDGAAIFAGIFDAMKPAMKVFGENLLLILRESFETLQDIFGPIANRFGVAISSGLAKGIVAALDALPGHSGIADLLRPAAELPWEEIVRQNPIKFNQPDFSGVKGIPKVDLNLPADLKGIPAFNGFDPASMDRFNAAIKEIQNTFGPGIAGLVKDAFEKAKAAADAMKNNLPQIGGNVAPRVDRFEQIGPLLFGTSAANAKETNVGSKNPLVPIAQQQLALTREQMVIQRAAAKAAERKARLAHF